MTDFDRLTEVVLTYVDDLGTGMTPFLQDLDEAGFAIVPKESTAETVEDACRAFWAEAVDWLGKWDDFSPAHKETFRRRIACALNAAHSAPARPSPS